MGVGKDFYLAPPSNIVEMEYPKDENHNPLVCELRTKPVAEEFECGYFPNRNDFQLFYRCWKLKNSSVHETQTVVVHVHGITSHSEMSIQLADGLVSKDIIVISFDLHGHGYSEGVRGDYKRFKGFIEDLEDFLFFAYDKYSQKNFVLSGESMGG